LPGGCFPARGFAGQGDTVVEVLKVAVILLVVLLVLVGLPLGMPMSGSAMCPECTSPTGCSALCLALLGPALVLAQRRTTRLVLRRLRRPTFAWADQVERPPRLSG
jgi:hypothetical protein